MWPCARHPRGGQPEELRGWGAHTLDERFADLVLMPGLGGRNTRT